MANGNHTYEANSGVEPNAWSRFSADAGGSSILVWKEIQYLHMVEAIAACEISQRQRHFVGSGLVYCHVEKIGLL